AGPTVSLVRQQSGWTWSLVSHHFWSYAGPDGRADVSSTYLQPAATYTLPDTTAIALSSESTYNWTSRQWLVPLILGASRLFYFGEQHVSLGVSGKYYAVSPENGPGWGVRMNVVFLFPQ